MEAAGHPTLTRAQERAIADLHLEDPGVRSAAVGDQVFVYSDEPGATLRVLVGPQGEILARRSFQRSSR